MESIAIVIVTYNRLKLLKECVDCALRQQSVEVELIIINNNSTDGTKKYLDSLNNSNIHIFHEESNIGGAGGFHDGVKYAIKWTSCNWILLIDDDAMLDIDYVKNIMEVVSENYNAYSGKVMVDGKIDTSHRLTINNTRIPDELYTKDVFECGIATFCGLLISRKIVDIIGFPMAEMFIWNDDTEYCLRISKYTKILNVNSAYLNHRTSNKIKSMLDKKMTWKDYYGIRNLIWIQKKYKKYATMVKKITSCYIKSIILLIKAVFDQENRDSLKYNAFLQIDAINDGFMSNLGKNNKYLP